MAALVVDLNGAFAGHSANTDAIKAIRAAIDLPIQLGGGIRDIAAVEAWLGRRHHPRDFGNGGTDQSGIRQRGGAQISGAGRIVVGADAKGGKIATEGWAAVSELTPVELGRRFEDAGVAAILFTDIDGDGLLKRLSTRRRLPHPWRALLHSGDRLGRLWLHRRHRCPAGWRAEPNIEGVVVGRALYDGRIDVTEALARAG